MRRDNHATWIGLSSSGPTGGESVGQPRQPSGVFPASKFDLWEEFFLAQPQFQAAYLNRNSERQLWFSEQWGRKDSESTAQTLPANAPAPASRCLRPEIRRTAIAAPAAKADRRSWPAGWLSSQRCECAVRV